MLENFQGDSWGSIPPLRMSSLLPHDLCHGRRSPRRVPALANVNQLPNFAQIISLYLHWHSLTQCSFSLEIVIIVEFQFFFSLNRNCKKERDLVGHFLISGDSSDLPTASRVPWSSPKNQSSWLALAAILEHDDGEKRNHGLEKKCFKVSSINFPKKFCQHA